MKKRFFLQSKDRLLLYLLALPLLFLLFLPFDFLSRKSDLQLLENRLDTVIHTTTRQVKKQEINNLLREHYATFDPAFIANRLESLELLKKEKTQLARQTNLQLPGVERLKERLRFLQEENIVRFTEKGGERREGVQEKLFSLSHPVEVDSADLKELVQRIEEKEAKAPLLLISSLKLSRKEAFGKNEVYDLNLEFIKREFCKP